MATAPTTKVVIIFYSLYSRTWQLAEAIAQGAREVPGVEVEIFQVPELLSPAAIEKMGATGTKELMSNVKLITPENRRAIITAADAVIWGSPTRFGSMTAELKSFIDGLGGLWFENSCVGKIASAFTGSETQHGGQEMTLFALMAPLLHLGFTYVGLPYSCEAMKQTKEVSGASPYGSSFVAGKDGAQKISDVEKECARFQGRHVAQVTKDLKLGRFAAETKAFTGGVPAISSSSSSASTTTAAASTEKVSTSKAKEEGKKKVKKDTKSKGKEKGKEKAKKGK